MRNGRIHKSVMGTGVIFWKVSPPKSLLAPHACPCLVAAAIATYRQSLDADAGTQFTFS